MGKVKKYLPLGSLHKSTMELKKNPKADLQRQRSLFLEIGLAVVLGICLVAFEWSSQDVKKQDISFQSDILEAEEMQSTTQEEQKPPEQAPVPVLSDVLVIVENNVKLSSDMDFFNMEDDRSGVKISEYKVQEEEQVEEDIPFQQVESPPSFKGGGVDAFRQWIAQSMKYPTVAEENGIQGRVMVQFTVSTAGDVVNVKVLRGVDPALDKEAIRVISSSPKWTPGKQREKPVRVMYVLPVIFQLN